MLSVALNHGSWAFSAALVCPLTARLGFRLTSVVGAVLAAANVMVSAFCENEIPFMFTFGVMAGFWSGASLWSTVLCMCKNFGKGSGTLAIAVAVGFASGSLGTLLAGKSIPSSSTQSTKRVQFQISQHNRGSFKEWVPCLRQK